ncbi:LytR C-terminal domain-containing protein [Nocardioides panacisoli]|uniref:LytR C-terminal domain-containing protein n=1 Tax=Nocardioides panacisoli TaxID=627624 RepID=UPI001C62757A|nr:LytR C-terminal domain-containing protein [Nocardioides panacisoli]QYJ02998.1 LytR C-terminal domain-containing protein [Nocardioides panacisoli]
MVDPGARSRSALTLVVLAVALVAAVGWGWSQVTGTLPTPTEDAGPCTDQSIAAGEKVRPAQVTVSVLNASDRGGLAGRTMAGLVNRGFGEGELANARTNSVDAGAVVWASRKDAGAWLVASHLGGKVEIVDQPSSYPGITVVLGADFAGLSKGRQQVTANNDTTVCVPN